MCTPFQDVSISRGRDGVERGGGREARPWSKGMLCVCRGVLGHSRGDVFPTDDGHHRLWVGGCMLVWGEGSSGIGDGEAVNRESMALRGRCEGSRGR